MTTQPVWEDPRVRAGMARQRTAWPANSPGWKVALGAPAVQEAVGITGPAVGFLHPAVPSGARLAIDGWTAPSIEPEIAVHLAADVPAGATREAVLAAIGGFGLAIEVIDLDGPLDDLEDVVATNIFHRAVVLGAPGSPALDTLRVTVALDGEDVAAASDPETVVGDLAALTAHVATYLGDGLSAGACVITGSLVPPVAVTAGQRLRVDAGPLGALELAF